MATADEKTVRITAEDHTAAALKSAGENFAKLHKEIQALRKQTEALAGDEERVQRRKTKAHNTTFESIIEGAFSAVKANAALGGQAQKTGGILGGVGKIGAAALNGMGVAIPGVVGGLASMAAGALGVGAALEVARRGFMGWAQFDTQLRLLQNSTGMTRAGVEGIAEAMRDLGNVTGDTKEELLAAFNELREAGNFTPEETKKMFPDIALVAKGMGANAGLVGRAVGDIARNFKIPADQVSKIYEGMAYAQEKFNLDVSKVGPQLSMATEGMARWGYTGADASNRMLAFMGSLKEATGDAGTAASVLTRIMNGMGSEQMAKALGFKNAEAFEEDLLASGDALGRMTYLMTTAKNQYDVMHAVGVRDIALWNKMKGELGTMADKIKGVSQATGALDKGLNITDGPENAVKRLTNAMNDLVESLGMFLDAFGATTVLKAFADDLATISRGAYRLVSLLKWALPGGQKPSWVKTMGEHSYNLQAPKDKQGKNITPYDEYLAGADPQAEAKAYWAKQQKGKVDATDKNERDEYNERVKRYHDIKKNKPNLRPVMPDIPESVRRDFPNLKPGQVTPTGTTTTAPTAPAPAGATSQGGTTTIETGPKAVITQPQGQLGTTPLGPATGGFQPMGGNTLLQTPQGQRLSGSMENATKQLVSFTQTMPDQGKARSLREGVQLASYSGDSFDGFPKKIDNTVIGRAFAAAQAKEESALRPQKTGGGDGTHMQGTGAQQYGGSMDARYLRAAYHPSAGGEVTGGSTGGDGRGGGATTYGPSTGPTNAPTGPGVETYSPDQRVPRSQRQSPYQRPPIDGRDPNAPVSPTTPPPDSTPPGAPGGTPGGTEPQGGLAADRAKFKAEMDANPALRDKVMRIAANEQGKHGLGTQAVIESMMNRASSRGRTLAQEAKWTGEGGYYEQGNMGRGALEDPAHRKVLEESLDKTLKGGNVSDYATDNASQALAAKRKRNQEMVPTKDYGGESFFRPGRVSGAGNVRRHAAWMEKMERQRTGTQTAATPPPAAAPGTQTAAAPATGHTPGDGHDHGAPSGGTLAADADKVISAQTATAEGRFEGPQVGRVQEAQGVVAGTRKGRIDARLKEAMDYAAEQSNVQVRVTSGGQRMHGAPGATGSHRHDKGGAADIDLIDPKTGKVLSLDDPRRLKFMEESARAGAGGTGARYMDDPNKIHVGITGSKARVGEGLGAYAGTAEERAAVDRGLRSRLTREQWAAYRARQQKATATAAAPAPAAPAAAAAPAAPTAAATPAPEEVPAPKTTPREEDRQMNVNLKVNDTQVQFARSTMRRQADREVREARWNSYSDIGAA